jgi:hypothetical protein
VATNSPRQETHDIKTLTQLCEELGAPVKTLRTLIIEHDVKFDTIGNAWVFSAEAADQVRDLFAEHQRKARALGLKPRDHKRRAEATHA